VPTRPSTPSPMKSHSIGTKDRDVSIMSPPDSCQSVDGGRE